MKTITSIVAAIALIAACGDAATKDDPCPRGLCTGPSGDDGGGVTGDGGTTTGDGGGACRESWGCTAWAKNAQGQYTRTCTDAAMCGTTNGKPNEGPLSLPDLDMDFYKCKVEPIVDRGCAFLGCHGTEAGRVYKVYARARLRRKETVPAMCLQTSPQDLQEMGSGTTMCDGWLPHTTGEWQENFDNARAFMVGVANPDDCELLSQPVIGGKNHTGVHLFAKTDADYTTIRQWLSGTKLGSTCNPDPN